MDILILNEKTADSALVGLSENKINKLISGWGRLTRKVHIICDPKFTTERKNNIELHNIGAVKTYRRGTMLYFLTHLQYFIKVLLKAIEVIKKNPSIKFIINVSGHFSLGLISVLISKICSRISLIRVTEDTGVSLFYRKIRSSGISLIDRIIYYLTSLSEKFAFIFADKIILAGLLENPERYQKFGYKTVLIPDVVEEFNCKIKSKLEKKTIVYACRLEWEKDPITFLKSVQELSRTRDDFEGIIVGNGSLETIMRKYVNANKLDAKVRFLKSLPHDQFIDFLSSAYVLVLTSWTEAMPNVVIEAFGCGVPVIAAKTRGPSYLIKEGVNGFLFDKSERSALTKHINKILDDEKLRDWMSNNCRRDFEELLKKDFGGDAVQKKYLLLIKN